MNISAENITISQLRASFASVNVYYEDLSYLYTTEAPSVTGSSLLGSIGKLRIITVGVNFRLRDCKYYIYIISLQLISSK